MTARWRQLLHLLWCQQRFGYYWRYEYGDREVLYCQDCGFVVQQYGKRGEFIQPLRHWLKWRRAA